MKNIKNSLQVSSAKYINQKSKAELGFLFVLAVIVCSSFSIMFVEAFPSVNNFLPFLFIQVAFSAACVFLSQKSFGKYVSLAVISVCSILSILMFSQVKWGAAALANDFMDFLTTKTGKIYLEFSLEANAIPELAFGIVSAFAAVFVSMALTEKNLFLALPVFILSGAGLLFGFLNTDNAFYIFAVGSTVATIYILSPNYGLIPKVKNAAILLLTLLLCFSVAMGTATLADPLCDGWLQNKVENMLHAAVYDSKTNSMPEGNLSNLGAWEKSDAAAVEITMNEPQKLYLKSFIGEVYNSEGWQEIDSKDLANYENEFYWLHEKEFFGQCEIFEALSALGEEETVNIITIKNISACKERMFLPYSFASQWMLNKAVIGDAKTEANCTEYAVSYIPGGLAEWYLAQVELASEQGKNDTVDSFLENEYIYREFVYENYLDVPESAFATIEKCFEGEDTSSFTKIINSMISYFSENITYDEDVVTQNGNVDFVEYFLSRSCRGYSVHYATAAVLMLRYFGIPARYVEGYFISAEEAQKCKDGETIVLDENHAHAWAEYYLDGVGWVPFEVTPGYMDDELEKAAFGMSGENSKVYAQSDKPKTNVEQERERDRIEEITSGIKTTIEIIAAAAMLALLFLIIYIVVMRRRLKTALQRIDEADNKNAIAMRFGYAEMLRREAGVERPQLDELGYENVKAINDEAIFSEHQMTGEQRKHVDTYSERLLACCKEKWNFKQRLWNKWIKCIYIK